MNFYILLDVVILIELQKYKKILPPPKLISVKIEACSVWLKSIWSIFNVLNQNFHSFPEGLQIITDHTIYKVCINSEITMSDMVAHPHYIFPWNIRTHRFQKETFCTAVNLFYPLTDSLQQHTCGSKSFHSFRRGGIFVGAGHAAAPFCYHINGFMDLEQSIDDDFFIE